MTIMNDTQRVLFDLAFDTLRARAKFDPEWVRLDEQEQTLFHNFCDRHQSNQNLCQNVIELMDILCAQSVYWETHSFWLGLQMGLELGAIDLLPPDQ